MAPRVPHPAYPAKDNAILYGDKELYARIGRVADAEEGKELVESFEVPIRSGKAWIVRKGWSWFPVMRDITTHLLFIRAKRFYLVFSTEHLSQLLSHSSFRSNMYPFYT